ncbi:MAG: DnaJ domain-containing protein [Myxococcota bacterium]
MRSERRNFYRILHLQPDAPPDVIRSNYRAMMQKLRMHPDLGGEHWDAAQISEAYATLSNPARRAAYDEELLEQYDLAALGEGRPEARRARTSTRRATGNRRNYYRVLQVQREAPLAVIEASHAALRQVALREGGDFAILDEAFTTLRDPERRRLYDAQLARPVGQDRVDTGHGAPGYVPRIKDYCAFCKTPAGAAERAQGSDCRECRGPLAPPLEELVAQARRAVARIGKRGALALYRYWPGPAQAARLMDLSPTGLRFSSATAFDVGEVIKIDGRGFRAVGEVAHRHPGWFSHDAGVRFVAVSFEQASGSFVSTRA